jgi:phage terminase large subunit-like protein
VSSRAEEIAARLEKLPPAALAAVRDQLAAKVQERRYNLWQPYPWQVCPGEVPAMGAWVLGGGRGVGKTDAGARYILDHVAGPPCDQRITGGHRIAIIAPTLGDASESAISGPSGLQTHDPRVKVTTSHGGTHVIFPNGSRGKVFGAHTKADIERLRSGGNRCCVWLEEAAAMRYLDAVITHSKMGLRIGPRPHYVVTTTPKPRAEIIKLWDSPKTLLTKGRTLDAYHLPPEMRQELLDEYGGTNLGRQELDGEILTDVRGALVSRVHLDRSRVPEAPDLNLIAIGFDPNGTGTGDECGIVAVGRGTDGDAYVLADASTKSTGRDAALRAWALFDDLEADVLVVEDNFAKSWLRQVLVDAWKETHDDENPPMKTVNAGQGKALRAQPMAMRFEQSRVHIVGTLDRLEAQFATWVPAETPDSPDRIDAAVHAFAYIRGKEKSRAKISTPANLGALR